MKKAITLFLALTLLLAEAIPTFAANETVSSVAGLTEEARTAYLELIERRLEQYGPGVSDDTLLSRGYQGMCGGYLVDLGGSSVPELLIPYYDEYYGFPSIEVIGYYSWNAISLERFPIWLSGNGRSGTDLILHRWGDISWLESHDWFLPMWDYSTDPPKVYDGGSHSTCYRVSGFGMGEYDPPTKEDEGINLRSADYFAFNNYDELYALLSGDTSAAAPIHVTVKGIEVQWTDAEPFIDENGRTLVPLRAVADALGLTVRWIPETRLASFTDGTKTISFPIGLREAYTFEGNRPLDTAAVIINDRTYAPARALAEYFGYEVAWSGTMRTVMIN